MTQETKNTVAAETIVENLKEFAMELHQSAKAAMFDTLIEKDEDTFVLAKFAHDISHELIDILQGKSADEALENVFSDDEDDSPVVGSIAVNLKTGDAHGIEDIKDPRLKQQLAEVIGKLAEKLGDK
ncbi:hypothetical protein GE023_005200 [Streptococcus canis]|uniref:hypothetical protein n=1 Tax=Streptococcus canis TaxID=1329 RepID=UPI0013DB43C2|nr:hypothetical protein [Streptococcus canis]QKG73716.1 hypothetical protein GE023_005200 [Streptococcus canis]